MTAAPRPLWLGTPGARRRRADLGSAKCSMRAFRAASTASMESAFSPQLGRRPSQVTSIEPRARLWQSAHPALLLLPVFARLLTRAMSARRSPATASLIAVSASVPNGSQPSVWRCSISASSAVHVRLEFQHDQCGIDHLRAAAGTALCAVSRPVLRGRRAPPAEAGGASRPLGSPRVRLRSGRSWESARAETGRFAHMRPARRADVQAGAVPAMSGRAPEGPALPARPAKHG